MNKIRPLTHGVALFFLWFCMNQSAHAGGPKYVAGATYFDPGVLGNPVVWAAGQLNYFVDQGDLGSLSHAQAQAMVDAAAAVWNGVPTAAVSLTDTGSLDEDVNGSNVQAGSAAPLVMSLTEPNDVSPSATTMPVGVIFDSDGSVIDALEGVGSSSPDNCSQSGVLMWVDNINTNATFAHGIMVINGRCTGTTNLLAMMSYQIERAFGRLLGLDFAQVNDGALTSENPEGALAWPIMDVIDGDCGSAGGSCISNPTMAHWDDVAAVNRMYPVTERNISYFAGKVLTAANTVSIQGTISFPDGQGMQGVNVVARPLDGSGNPMYQYTVTFVSGGYYSGNHGNPVTGWYDAAGNRLDRFGGNSATLEGYFDLSGMPLPQGVTTANYQLSFEEVNPLYFGGEAVGPYWQGSPAPSGLLGSITVTNLSAGSTRSVAVAPTNQIRTPIFNPVPRFPVSNLDVAIQTPIRGDTEGTEAQPEPLPATGAWTSLLGTVGASDWFMFPVQGNRIFTVVAQAMDATGVPTDVKAMPAVGVWDGVDVTDVAPDVYASAFSGGAVGEAPLQLYASESEILRIGITDQRGDGRPDYLYRGWVLYADSVYPQVLPQSGGPVTINGFGFHRGDSVYIDGNLATTVTISPTQITATAPPNTAGAIGSLDLVIMDFANYNAMAAIPGGISYDAASGDSVAIVSAPTGQVPLNTPQAFTVLVKHSTGLPAGGVSVTFSVSSSTATLGCGQPVCTVTTNGKGIASLSITATTSASATVHASLDNGSLVSATFFGIPAPQLTAITAPIYVAVGATIQWPVQALVLNNSLPLSGQSVSWQSVASISAPPTASISDTTGVASALLTVANLATNQVAVSLACLRNGSACAPFTAYASEPALASLSAISGSRQDLPVGSSALPILLRVLDPSGNPIAAANVTVNQSLYAWSPACPVHGRCDQAQLLATQQSVATSGLDGSVSISPLALAGSATNLVGVASIGNSGVLEFMVDTHP